ncbi:MAG: SDR family oxidoreductase [Bacteriovorax sp.]|nr:SDR family oxidoreductase [Bacteriovorax sp.]
MSNVKGKKSLALITGGTKGFGKRIAARLSNHYNLALIFYNDTENAKKVLEEFSSDTCLVKIYQCDVSDEMLSKKVYEKIKEDFQMEASVLVNSAGVAIKNLFIMESLSDHKRSFEVNYFGTINMCKLVLPAMMKDRFGRIINLSSNNVSINNRGSAAYCASKAALEKFGDILGGEVARSGVTVNTIRPGISKTDMSQDYLDTLSKEDYQELLQPSGQLINPDEIAKAVEFLINSTQINSSTLTVDCGHALFRKI